MAQQSRVKSTARKYKNQTRWTLLLVGDLGKVASFQITKLLVLALLACLAVGLSMFVYSVVSYNLVRMENNKLKNDLDILSASLKGVEKDREEALVRLMLREASGELTAEKASTDSEQGTEGVASEVAERTRPAPAKSSSPPEAGKLAPPVSTARVSVENLEIWQESGDNKFMFQFLVKNIDRERGKVAGYAFLTLKPEEGSGESSRVFPPIPLEDGKPSSFEKGHHFSIARYTHIRGTLIDVSTIQSFRAATIWVYSESGDFQVKKTFDVSGVLRS